MEEQGDLLQFEKGTCFLRLEEMRRAPPDVCVGRVEQGLDLTENRLDALHTSKSSGEIDATRFQRLECDASIARATRGATFVHAAAVSAKRSARLRQSTVYDGQPQSTRFFRSNRHPIEERRVAAESTARAELAHDHSSARSNVRA